MQSVNEHVKELLNQSVSVQKCLSQGLINTRALARFLIDKYELTYSVDAVLSSIRRYTPSEHSPLVRKEVSEAFKDLSVYTKDNMAKIVLCDSAFTSLCEDFLNGKQLKQNVRIIKGKEVVSILISQKEYDLKRGVFASSEIIAEYKNLAEIRLHFSSDVTTIPSVTARVMLELANKGVTVIEDMYCTPDYLVYVAKKDLLKAHEALLSLS